MPSVGPRRPTTVPVTDPEHGPPLGADPDHDPNQPPKREFHIPVNLATRRLLYERLGMTEKDIAAEFRLAVWTARTRSETQGRPILK